MADVAFDTIFPSGGMVALKPILYSTAATYNLTPPAGAKAVIIQALSAGGGGGKSTTNAVSTGGAGGSQARIVRAIAETDTLTIVVPAGGAGFSATDNTAGTGTAGAAATASNGSWTLTVSGGLGGNFAASANTVLGGQPGATPSISDGGAIHTQLGGAGGDVTHTSANNSSTGGGSAALPNSDGFQAGSVTGAGHGQCTGGASPFARSGDCSSSGTDNCTGGAGRAESAACTGANASKGTGGGSSDPTVDVSLYDNALNPAHAWLVFEAYTLDTNPRDNSFHEWDDIHSLAGHGDGGFGGSPQPYISGGPDAGGGAYPSATAPLAGPGGPRGGGGAACVIGNGVTGKTVYAGDGGRYAGGGATASRSNATIMYGGDAGAGAGGASCGGSNGSPYLRKAGDGGDGEIFVTWLVGVPSI